MAKEVVHDIKALLSSADRDYLVRNNGDQAKIEDLKGKKVGLYFSASWCGPCRQFTPDLVDAYNELSSNGVSFEIVFVSADGDEESFNGYFLKMPWLAIPFSDSDIRHNLDKVFQVSGIPHLVILGEDGKVLSDKGTRIIQDFGAEGYPFTPERIQELKDREEASKRDQSLRSVLGSRTRDHVLSSDGQKVLISELEGKTVALYFLMSLYKSCAEFTPVLVDVYEKLRSKGESFEVVTISLDGEEESYKEGLANIPWFSLPLKDKTCVKLVKYFELSTLPTLVIVGPDGKTLNLNAANAIEEHGVLAYPFTPEKFAELAEIEKAKEEAQTLESILVSGEHDFVIGKNGVKIPVSDLVGKNILLYFSAHWCHPCRAFTPKLIEAYHNIKATDEAFEVVFVSSDSDQDSFDEYFSGMPWLALPLGDPRKASLSRKFKVSGIPTLVAIGPTGKTVSRDARDLVMTHGADAYPFTEERLKQLEDQMEEMKKGWPEKLKHTLHEHELELVRGRTYICDGCDEHGTVWSFYCGDCDFDLHPKCALEAREENKDEVKDEEKPKLGWKCDGDACHKA